MQLGKPKLTPAGLFGICISLSLVLAVDAYAESKIYKYVDKNGVVSFSSKPPPGAKEAAPVDIPEGNIIHKRTDLTEQEKEFQRKDKELGAKLDQRIKKQKERAREIASAKQEVKKRKEELEKGKEPLPGERVGTVYGNSRLRPSYHQRVKRLEEQLAAAEKKLKDLEKSK